MQVHKNRKLHILPEKYFNEVLIAMFKLAFIHHHKWDMIALQAARDQWQQEVLQPLRAYCSFVSGQYNLVSGSTSGWSLRL